MQKNKKRTTIASYLIPVSLILFGMRHLFCCRMAYSDFYPFSDTAFNTLRRFLFLWGDNFTGSFDPKTISYLIRFFLELISGNNPIIAQVLYTSIFFIMAYVGMRFFINEFVKNKIIGIIIPIFYVYNPITISEYANGITGILIIYSIIPWLFFLLRKFSVEYKVIYGIWLSVIVAILVLNLQTGFWILVFAGFFVLMELFAGKMSFKNLGRLTVFGGIGLMLNPSFAFIFLNVTQHFSGSSYIPDFVHNYKRISFLNLFRMIGNNGTPQFNLGYFNYSIYNILAIIPFGVIVFGNTSSIIAKVKKGNIQKRILVFFLLTFLFINICLVSIHNGFFNELIENKNLLLISIRNPQKILYIYSFIFIFLLAISLDTIYLRKRFKKIFKYILILVCFSLFLQNHYIFSGDFGLKTTRKSGYYINKHSQDIINVLHKLDNEGGHVLVLPFDYSMQLKYSWNNNVAMSKMGAKKTGDDYSGELLRYLYGNICDNDQRVMSSIGRFGIDFVLIDKKAFTYKKHVEKSSCKLSGLYGTPYIWGNINFFEEVFKSFPVVYDNEDIIIYLLRDKFDIKYVGIYLKMSIFGGSGSDDLYDLKYKQIFSDKTLKNGLNFAINDDKKEFPAERVSSLFENIDSSYFDSGAINQYIDKKNNTELYLNKGKKELVLNVDDNNLIIKNIFQEHLEVNNQPVLQDNTLDNANQILYTEKLTEGDRYYLKNGSSILTVGESVALNENLPVEIYKTQGDNIVENGSFENGLWSDRVGDCNDYDDNGILAMKKVGNASEGNYALELQATKHIACTSQKNVSVEPGKDYLLSFDYQSDNAQQAGYYLGFQGKEEAISEKLPITDKQWRKYSRIITVPDDVDKISLYVYSYEEDGQKNVITRYDNFNLQKLELVKEIQSDKNDNFVKVDLPDDEKYHFAYNDKRYNYGNLIANGSLENGLWKKKVSDCNNYDNNPILDMKEASLTSDGKKSLELQATRHIACTGPGIIPVKGGVDYLLEFDYQSDNGLRAGYNLGFNDEEKTNINEKINIKKGDKGWKTFSKKITVPVGASNVNLTVYSYAKDKKTNIITRYDNFKFIELPDLNNRYYLVSEPTVELAKPQSVEFDLVNPTKKLVHIKGATKPFYLTMSESYHDKWQAQLNNSKVRGFFGKWVPFVKPDVIADEQHFKYMTFLNGWYINPQDLCEDGNGVKNGCTKNDDGSYDIEMVIEFTPQRWFYLGLLISGTTFMSLIGYLGYDFIKRRRKNIS